MARVQCIYRNASFASVRKDQCFKLVLDYNSLYMFLLRKNKSLNSSQGNEEKVKKTKEHPKILFDFFWYVNVILLKNVPSPKLKRFPY